MITLSEILVRAARGSARSHLNAIVSSVTTLPNVRFMDLNRDHAIEASIVRAETGLKFPDSAVIATARLANATALIGNDRAWIGRNLGVRYIHMDDLLDSLRSVGR